jgi:hypothetical protein
MKCVCVCVCVCARARATFVKFNTESYWSSNSDELFLENRAKLEEVVQQLAAAIWLCER